MKNKVNVISFEYQNIQRKEAIEALKKIKEKENGNKK